MCVTVISMFQVVFPSGRSYCFSKCLVLVSVVLVSLISLIIVFLCEETFDIFYVGLNINEIVCSDMQYAAGNIFVDRSWIWIRRQSYHSVINILVGIF